MASAREHGMTQPVLQLPHLMADRRLRDAELSCGQRKLICRAAASKARNAPNGGRRRMFSISSVYRRDENRSFGPAPEALSTTTSPAHGNPRGIGGNHIQRKR